MGAFLLGRTPDEIIGCTIREILEDAADEIEPSLRRILQGWDRVFVTHEFNAPDGKVLMDAVYTPVFDSAGEVRRVVGICRDVTKDQARIKRLEGLAGKHPEKMKTLEKKLRYERDARRMIAGALRDNNYLLDEILTKFRDGICVYHNISESPRIRFSHWNYRMTEMTGYTMSEINALGARAFNPIPEAGDSTSNNIATIFDGTEKAPLKWTITTRSKEERVVSISSSILKEENGVTHVLAVMRDAENHNEIDGKPS